MLQTNMLQFLEDKNAYEIIKNPKNKIQNDLNNSVKEWWDDTTIDKKHTEISLYLRIV